MKNLKQKLLIKQVDKKIKPFKSLENIIVPGKGWVNAIRTALKMSLRQFGEKMHITPQSAREIEQRELKGTITIKSLRQAAQALDMKLIYGFVPKEMNLEKMIERRSLELACEIVSRTSNTMKLEGQENSRSRIKKSIEYKTKEIVELMPRYLWD